MSAHEELTNALSKQFVSVNPLAANVHWNVIFQPVHRSLSNYTHVAVELIERLQRKDFKGNTLTLKIKFHDFSQITRSLTQSQELTTLDRVLPLAKELLKSVEFEQHPIRLIGLSVSNPKEEADEQHGVWEQLSFEFSDWD
mgnify:CR=1 FL=1